MIGENKDIAFFLRILGWINNIIGGYCMYIVGKTGILWIYNSMDPSQSYTRFVTSVLCFLS